MRRMPMRLQQHVIRTKRTQPGSGKNGVRLDMIYYINLDRRTDRNQHFLKQCRDAGLEMSTVRRFTGIDGKTFTPTRGEEAMFTGCKYKDSPFIRNLMGNQLSHYYILQDMMEKGYENILILQDDVVFRSQFRRYLDDVLRSVPADAEIINIGMHKLAAFADFEPIALEDDRQNRTPCKRRVNPCVCEIRDEVNPCSLAYIVTREGCRNLLEHFRREGFRDATDINYNNYLREKNINYASSRILCTGALLGTDVWA